MSNEPEKIIYTMMRVGKAYQNKPVLKDISLSYFLGAKIGVLGLNASGKSSLLRIMAGVDQEYDGKAVLSPGYTLGFLDRIATHILAFEGDSTVMWFEGNCSDYEADRKKRLGKAAEQPHRIKYRHLTRR